MSDIRLTNYPDKIDNIENMREPTEEELALIQAGNYDELTDDAKNNVFITAKKINTMIDGIKSWQQFTKQWIEDGYVHQGAYSSIKNYYPRDVVTSGGVSYLCIGFRVIGENPENSKKWVRLTGATGAKGATGIGQKGDPAELIYIDTGGVNYIAKNANGELSNSTLTIKPYSKTGSNNPRALSSYIYIYTKASINGDYVQAQSAGSTTSFDYSIPKNIAGIKIIIKNRNSVELAVKEIPIIQISNSVVNTYDVDCDDDVYASKMLITEKYASDSKVRDYDIQIIPKRITANIPLRNYLIPILSIDSLENYFDLETTFVYANISINNSVKNDPDYYNWAFPLIRVANFYVNYSLDYGYRVDEGTGELLSTELSSNDAKYYTININIKTRLK